MPGSRTDGYVGNDDGVALRAALQEIWAALGTNDLSRLESSIEHLSECCTSCAVDAVPSFMSEIRRNSERVKALLNRRSRDLQIFAQVSGAAGLRALEKQQSIRSTSCQR
jgi:hypothetical protein